MRKRVLVVSGIVVMLGFCVDVMKTVSSEEERLHFADVRGMPQFLQGVSYTQPAYKEMRRIEVGPIYHQHEVLAKLLEESFRLHKKWGGVECMLITWAHFEGTTMRVLFEGRTHHLKVCKTSESKDMPEPIAVYEENFYALYDEVEERHPEEVMRQVRVKYFSFNLWRPEAVLVLERIVRLKEAAFKQPPIFFAII